MIKHILFDADQTLYPASSCMEEEMIRRINTFVAEYLGVTVEEAASFRATRDKKYNSTLEWLREAKGFSNPESFFSAIHPVDLENYFPKNPDLVSLLSKISVPCSIFSNSWQKHVENILKYLEISHFFTNIFDIIFNNYFEKPHAKAFSNVLSSLGLKPNEVLFIDDIKKSADTFFSLGGNVILVDESGKYGKTEYEKVCSIEEIEPILAEMHLI